MTSVCFYFQVHQPMRLRRLHSFKPADGYDYWDNETNRAILNRTADKCYLPANALILDLIKKSDGWFRVAYSISGVFLEQAMKFRPDVIESFQALAATGHVEFLDETFYHSLASLWNDPVEYTTQIRQHRDLMKRLFGQAPTVFRNTELIYDDRIAAAIEEMGYEAIITEGTERILGDRSPNHVYAPEGRSRKLRVLLKNYRLSDDIAFRFSSRGWGEFPLTADKFATWLSHAEGETINLFMDYETFGEHQWPETGIFEFLRCLPDEVRKYPHLGFALPHEVIRDNKPVGTIAAPQAISWADTERDVSAWLQNKMQQQCFEKLRSLGPAVRAVNDPALSHAWRLLQTSDHLYYCTTKHFGDQDIHAYFSPYESPYVAYINYRNAIEDVTQKVNAAHRP